MGCCGWRGADQEPVHAPGTAATEGILARRRSAAQADLAAATGGEGLCRASGDTSGWDAALSRGRVDALADVAAALRASPGRPLATVAEHVLRRWEADPGAGPDDRSGAGHRAGGLAELRSLVAELTAGRPDRHGEVAGAVAGSHQRSVG